MEEVINKTLPTQVVYTEKVATELERIQRKVDAAKTAWKELKAMPDFKELVTDLGSLSKSAIRQKADEAIKSAYASWLPSESKKRAEENWRKLELTAWSYISQIEAAQSVVELRDDGQGGIEAADDLKCWAERQVTRATPSRAFEHYELAAAVIEALDKLRRWEEEQDKPSIWLHDLEALVNDPVRFAAEWITGTFAPLTVQEQQIRERFGNKRAAYRY